MKNRLIFVALVAGFSACLQAADNTKKTEREKSAISRRKSFQVVSQNKNTKEIKRPVQETKTEPEIKAPERAAGGRVLASNIASPSPAQAKAGNYSKDHIHINGLPITVENAKGSMRHGVGPNGKKWSAKLYAHYGYLKRSEGADGDHVDVYVGPHIKSDKAFIINQIDHNTKEFDEHKCMLFFGSLQQALNTYEKGFSDGKGLQRVGSIVATDIPTFKHWLKEGNTKRPFCIA